MTTNDLVALAIFASPLVGFLLISLVTLRIRWLSGVIAIVSIAIPFVLSVSILPQVLAAPDRTLELFRFHWLQIGDLEVTFGFTIDPLTAVMLLVVTGVSTLVQIYSTSYLGHDRGYTRFFAFMTLFTASMLGLILVDNLIFVYVFWELVGLCSYLLIGYWYTKPSAAAAAKKAFIVTRIGDFGFMIAILLIWVHMGTFEIPKIIALSTVVAPAVLTWIALGVFAGAVGKSAQFPLHFWLPDAMEGPTPVSALVHSATMVAAGVYLVARMFPMFVNSPDAMATVAVIGGFTAIFAASMGLVMYDIKRVLAYSTISQLGYMMLALGVGGYVPAVFHLMNHAFFKAMLFLGSGSVNHATNTYDMRLMGGLRRFMPWTYGTFLIGSLSLAGIVPLAGFWSKDEIILYVFNSKLAVGPVLFAFALITAFMTAFYMFRAIFMTFHGEYRGGAEPEAHDDAHGEGGPTAQPAAEHGVHSHSGHGWKAHPHESPVLMVLPLAVLAIPSMLSGFLNTPFSHVLATFLHTETIQKAEKVAKAGAEAPAFDPILAAVALIVAASGIALAWLIYGSKLVPADLLTRPLPWLHTMILNKYGVDILAEDLVVTRAFNRVLCGALAWFDSFIVDGVVNGVGRVIVGVGGTVRFYQGGQVQVYGASIFIGLIIIIAGFVFLRPV